MKRKKKKNEVEVPETLQPAPVGTTVDKAELVKELEGALGPIKEPLALDPNSKPSGKHQTDSKKALLGELRAVLDDTKQEQSAKDAKKLQEQALLESLELTAQKSVELPEAETAPVAAQTEEAPETPPLKVEPLASVTYESVAKAAETAKKESTGRFSRDAVDDETFLAEIYSLIGEGKPKKVAKPEQPAAEATEQAPVQTAPTPRPVVRITQEQLQSAPADDEVPEDDTTGVPGWIKGIFLLLLSLLLSAMTFYAVASDVLGEIF